MFEQEYIDEPKFMLPSTEEKIWREIEPFLRDTCVWTRSGIDLGGEQKIYATACNKEWPYISVPPHKCGLMVCHGCVKRIIEEFLS